MLSGFWSLLKEQLTFALVYSTEFEKLAFTSLSVGYLVEDGGSSIITTPFCFGRGGNMMVEWEVEVEVMVMLWRASNKATPRIIAWILRGLNSKSNSLVVVGLAPTSRANVGVVEVEIAIPMVEVLAW